MSSSIKIIKTDKAAPAGGHYVQATVYQGQIYISGQLPVTAEGKHTFHETFEIQARQAMKNLLAILEAAGGNPANLLKVTVYLVGVENWPAFNLIYAEMLGETKPARAVVPVPELHHGYLIEIDAVAAAISE
ncbi:RidA family protein [Dyadobacter sp. CY356]|uniref:RidA family protein n=1 Tax=Dyadobacter sp. CY356 TaxID=2906442 RepID=UPI001F3B8022|nr:RidA family protein [Dyadobacter sp. CY356]MCF0056013.1 RidA family protein [Dyadobacter sp. CY356]